MWKLSLEQKRQQLEALLARKRGKKKFPCIPCRNSGARSSLPRPHPAGHAPELCHFPKGRVGDSVSRFLHSTLFLAGEPGGTQPFSKRLSFLHPLPLWTQEYPINLQKQTWSLFYQSHLLCLFAWLANSRVHMLMGVYFASAGNVP